MNKSRLRGGCYDKTMENMVYQDRRSAGISCHGLCRLAEVCIGDKDEGLVSGNGHMILLPKLQVA